MDRYPRRPVWSSSPGPGVCAVDRRERYEQLRDLWYTSSLKPRQPGGDVEESGPLGCLV